MAILTGNAALQYMSQNPQGGFKVLKGPSNLAPFAGAKQLTQQEEQERGGVLGGIEKTVGNIPLIGGFLKGFVSPVTGTIGHLSDFGGYALKTLADPRGERSNLYTDYKATYNPKLFEKAKGLFDKPETGKTTNILGVDLPTGAFEALFPTYMEATAPALELATLISSLTTPFKPVHSVLGKTVKSPLLGHVLGGVPSGILAGGLEAAKTGDILKPEKVLPALGTGALGGGIGGATSYGIQSVLGKVLGGPSPAETFRKEAQMLQGTEVPEDFVKRGLPSKEAKSVEEQVALYGEEPERFTFKKMEEPRAPYGFGGKPQEEVPSPEVSEFEFEEGVSEPVKQLVTESGDVDEFTERLMQSWSEGDVALTPHERAYLARKHPEMAKTLEWDTGLTEMDEGPLFQRFSADQEELLKDAQSIYSPDRNIAPTTYTGKLSPEEQKLYWQMSQKRVPANKADELKKLHEKLLVVDAPEGLSPERAPGSYYNHWNYDFGRPNSSLTEDQVVEIFTKYSGNPRAAAENAWNLHVERLDKYPGYARSIGLIPGRGPEVSKEQFIEEYLKSPEKKFEELAIGLSKSQTESNKYIQQAENEAGKELESIFTTGKVPVEFGRLRPSEQEIMAAEMDAVADAFGRMPSAEEKGADEIFRKNIERAEQAARKFRRDLPKTLGTTSPLDEKRLGISYFEDLPSRSGDTIRPGKVIHERPDYGPAIGTTETSEKIADQGLLGTGKTVKELQEEGVRPAMGMAASPELDKIQRIASMTEDEGVSEVDKLFLKKVIEDSEDFNLQKQARVVLDKVEPGWENKLTELGEQWELDMVYAPPSQKIGRRSSRENTELYKNVIANLKADGYDIADPVTNIGNIESEVSKYATRKGDILRRSDFSITAGELAEKIKRNKNLLALAKKDPGVSEVLSTLELEGIPVLTKTEEGLKYLKNLDANQLQDVIWKLDKDIFRNNTSQVYSGTKAKTLKYVRDELSKLLKGNVKGYASVNEIMSPYLEYIRDGHAVDVERIATGRQPLVSSQGGMFETIAGGAIGATIGGAPGAAGGAVIGKLVPGRVKLYLKSRLAKLFQMLGSKQSPAVIKKILDTQMGKIGARSLTRMLPYLGAKAMTRNIGTPAYRAEQTQATPLGVPATSDQITQGDWIPEGVASYMTTSEGPTRTAQDQFGSQGPDSRGLALQLLGSGMSPSDTETIMGLLGYTPGGETGGEAEAELDPMVAANNAAKQALILLQSGEASPGPLSGRLSQAKQSLLGTADTNSQYRQALSIVNSAITRAFYGTQVSEAARQQMQGMLPSPYDTPELAAQKLQGIISMTSGGGNPLIGAM